MTRWPRASKIRARLSPMTVERMWPTCIGLATLGDEKSMTTVRGCAGGAIPGNSPASRSASARAIQASCSRTLRKPGPATSGGPASGSRSTAAATWAARSRGLIFSDFPGPCSRWPGNRRTWGRSWRGRRPRRRRHRRLPESPRRRRLAIVREHSWQGLRASECPARPDGGSIGLGSVLFGSAVGRSQAAARPRGPAAARGSPSSTRAGGISPDLLEGVVARPSAEKMWTTKSP